jgi:hypothetical protein
MRKKQKELPKITVVNGWERKNFIIEQKDEELDWDSPTLEYKKSDKIIKIEFLVKYKNPKSENVEFEILEIDSDGEENTIDFCESIEICELKLLLLKTCLTFLKTGALVLEQQ